VATAPLTERGLGRSLQRSYWTPLLLLAAGAIGVARTWLVTPGGLRSGNELEAGAFFGGVLGAALLPWAAGALAAYIHWFWNKTRRDRDYMNRVYPYRRRAVLHGTVLLVLLLMASELIWRLATGATTLAGGGS